MPLLRLLFGLFCLAAAAWLALLGLGTPVHFRAVSKEALSYAARGTQGAFDLALERLAATQPGPAALLLRFAEDQGTSETKTRALEGRIRALENARPLLARSGGEAPYFNAFLEEAPVAISPDAEGGAVAQVVPLKNRRVLLKQLERLPNETVQQILSARHLGGWAYFAPATTAAGAPLDTAILMSALLTRGSLEPLPLTREMAALISAAKAGDAEAARQLETAFLSVLSLGKRLDWMQWRVLVQRMDSLRELRRVSAFVRAYPNRLPLLYTSLLMSGDDPVQTVAAVEKLSGRTATPLEELSLIARLGTGALRKYIEDPKPLYEAPPLLARLEPVVQRVQPEPLVALGANRPGTAGLAKTLAFVGAGLLTMLGLSAWWRAAASLRRAKPREAGRPGAAEDFADTRGGWVMIVRYLASALIVCAVLWAMAEPRLLEHEQARAELRFDLVFTQTIGSLSSGSMMMGAIDQVTLLVLLLFFLVQLVIYAFCLIKISEIRRSAVPAAVRLSLLENEDNLFDMGLYVGLGGTVASLILVTLGVVEASLMAAYASTLFGILTTAIIKVFHLRPLRRNLILEREGRVLE